ncbi:sugar ABC transporter permease [bacterium]|nr:sugar ABC transporter permease [bacterium]
MKRWGGLVLLVPALLGLVLFLLIPFVLSFLISFTDLRLGTPYPIRFVGLGQYSRLAVDQGVLRALRNNLLFGLFVPPIQTGLALTLACLVNRPGWRLAVPLRALFFLPVLFPMSLVAVIWRYLYAPGPLGPFNWLLGMLTFGMWQPHDFLHEPRWALPALALLSVWQGVGLQMVLLLGGLQQVPVDLYEAAAMDGAGPWLCFRRITLPMLRNTLVFTTLMTTILAFRLFDQVQILTQGGPADCTTTLMYELFRSAFERQQMGRACALTVLLVGIVIGLAALQRLAVREQQL